MPGIVIGSFLFVWNVKRFNVFTVTSCLCQIIFLIRIQTLGRAYLFAISLCVSLSIKHARSCRFWKSLPPEFCETSDMGLYDTGASVSIVIVSGWFDMNSFIEVSVWLGNWPMFDDDIWMLNDNASEIERFWACDVWSTFDDTFVSWVGSDDVVLTSDRIMSFFIVKFNFCWPG